MIFFLIVRLLLLFYVCVLFLILFMSVLVEFLSICINLLLSVSALSVTFEKFE